MDRTTRSLISTQVLVWLACIVVLLLMMMVSSCSVSPPPEGTDIGDPSEPVWVAGDSISWPTAIRIPGTYAIGIGGTGCYKEPSIFTQTQAAIDQSGQRPHLLLVITGINDLVGGNTVTEVANCVERFRATYEAQGTDVRFVTEPVPDNGTGPYPTLIDYNNFLRWYPDTIDCGPAGHPTESRFANSYPVHPTAQGYDNYAACIQSQISWEIIK